MNQVHPLWRMPTWMPSPSALRTFDAAARCGSFKAAAAELAVTPTSVSHQVKALETQLGVSLFERSTRKVELTAAGRRLAEATGEAFDTIALALEDIAVIETELSITTTPAFAALWLMPRLHLFEAQHPGFRVRLETGTRPVDLVRERGTDVAIRYGSLPWDEKLSVHELASEGLRAFAAPSFLAKNVPFEKAPLIETRWCSAALPAAGWSQWAELAGLPDHGIERAVRRYDQEHYVVQAGMAGQGIVLVSDFLVQDHLREGWLEVYRPDVRLPGFRYSLICLKDRLGARKVLRFLTWIQAQANGSNAS
jgi:DNA-binding transcriptional LysR family regulator